MQALLKNLEKTVEEMAKPVPLQSLQDLEKREAQEAAVAQFLQTMEKCEEMLKKRTSTDAELRDFFKGKKIQTQKDLLASKEPNEVAAYFVSGKEVVPIDRSVVHEWLVYSANQLSPEMVQKVSSFYPSKIVVNNRYHLDQIKAAHKSHTFRAYQQQFFTPSYDYTPYVKWIENGTIPDFAQMDEDAFNDFQQLLLFLMCDDFLEPVLEENKRRYSLNLHDRTLSLKPQDNVQLHYYFRSAITQLELPEGEGNPNDFPNLKLLRLNPFEHWSLPKGNYKIEFIGDDYPKGIEPIAERVINFEVKDHKDWALLTKMIQLERIKILTPMDRGCLNKLKNLKAIRCDAVPLRDQEVVQLVRENRNLESLILPSSTISKEGFSALSALLHLKELVIKFTEIDLEFWQRNPSLFRINRFSILEKLTLAGPLETHDLDQIVRLRSLKELDIGRCQVSNLTPLLPLLQSGIKVKLPRMGEEMELERWLQRNNVLEGVTIVE